MTDILAAIRDGEALPATGTAHGHVRLKDGRLARIAYAHEGDPTAAARLHLQADAFRRLAPAGRTPKLYEMIEPRPGLPGGALIVDFVEGQAPRHRAVALAADAGTGGDGFTERQAEVFLAQLQH